MVDPLSPVNHRDPLTQKMMELHCGYLFTHESLQKLEEKKRLENQIREYLMVAPHEKKFSYQETGLILHRSAELKENFNAIRASAAFTAIAALAHNLLAQPWRVEFREIKTYSGFFKHNIENGLVGSELMLNLMGYREIGEGTFILDGLVDLHKVANVSMDSLVALVECQILCSLYKELLSTGCHFTWLEILQYREANPCTMEQALTGLMYQYNQRYLNACRLDCYAKCNMMDYSYKPPHYRPHSNMHFPYYDAPDSVPMLNTYQGMVNPLSKCTTCHTDYSSAPPIRQNNEYSVPTGQLIELDVPCAKDIYPYDTDNQKRYVDKIEPHGATSFNTNDSNSNMMKQKFTNEAAWSTLGATYQPPESKNNFRYDTLSDQRHSQNFSGLEESLKALHIDDPQPSCSTSEPKPFENTADKTTKKIYKYESNIAIPSSSQTLGRDTSKKAESNYMSLKVKLSEKWECPTCTYHNTNDKDVCEMCSKSKVSGNEVQPLVSGGRQCPKCTLVNEKGVHKCEACGANLKDSPTYI